MASKEMYIKVNDTVKAYGFDSNGNDLSGKVYRVSEFMKRSQDDNFIFLERDDDLHRHLVHKKQCDLQPRVKVKK